MSARIAIQKSNFTAGELKPSLHAREDLAIYQNGASKLENRIVLPEGGVVRRPGTRMVTPLIDETQPGKLMAFKYSRADARMLCLSGGKAMVLTPGGGIVLSLGVPYTFDQPWGSADYPALRWTESASVVYVASGRKPQIITRVADTNWNVGDYQSVNGPTRSQNIDTAKTIAVSGLTGAITLTANFNAFQAGHVGSIWRLDEGNLATVPYWTANENIAVTTATNAPATYRRFQGAVYAAFAGAPATLSAGVNPPTQKYGTFISAPGCVVWQFLYQNYGYVQITGFTDATHVSANVLGIGETSQTVLPDSLAATPTYRWSEAAWSDVRGWPTLTTFSQQRMGWLRSYEFWLTNTGDYYRFEATAADDSAIAGAMLSLDGSLLQPQWAVTSGWIVVGCSDCEPVLRGPGTFDALTQANITAVIDKGQGSAFHVPAVADAGVLAIGVSRQRVNYVKIDRLVDSVRSDEISTYANHILRGLAAALVYQLDPNHVAWGFSQNGDFWAFTFRPDQQVIAWARQPMPNGFVEEIAANPSADGASIEVWMIVRRLINGVTRRFVEIMTPFFQSVNADAPDATGAWFVDCGLSYAGPAVSILSAPHLAGASVRVLADGAWLGDFTADPVTGAVTLPRKVTNAILGLPMKSKLRTLPLDPTRPGTTTRGDAKQATHASVDFLETYGGEAFMDALDDEGNWQHEHGAVEGLFPSAANALAPNAQKLFTGRKSFPMESSIAKRIELELVDDHPYPSTILALAPDVEDGEI